MVSSMLSIWQFLPLKHRIILGGAVSILIIALLIPTNSDSAVEALQDDYSVERSNGTLDIPIRIVASEAEVRTRVAEKPSSSAVQDDAPAKVEDVVAPAPIIDGSANAEASDPIATQEVTQAATVDEAPQFIVQTDQVREGDTLSEIFERNRAGIVNSYAVWGVPKYREILSLLMPGQELVFYKNQDSSLASFEYWPNLLTKHHFTFNEEIDYVLSEREPDVERKEAHAVINSSLFLAGRAAGISENMTMDLAAIFGWDIDFILDIREGDEFKVIWDEFTIDGTVIETQIAAAQFVNDGEVYNAIAFEDDNGRRNFYDQDGMSMRKAFLRTPVEFARISSPFNPNRRHPVLNTIRAHKGTDYAAPTGTPIKASGDGRIIHLGNKGGYGKTIIIQHGHNIRTLYAHMNGYARGLRNGSSVRQGQVIGYVGATGMVTGPHLHYEFLVNGVHRNPQTVALPEANPIANQYKARFNRLAQPLVAKLDGLNLLASN